MNKPQLLKREREHWPNATVQEKNPDAFKIQAPDGKHMVHMVLTSEQQMLLVDSVGRYHSAHKSFLGALASNGTPENRRHVENEVKK